MEQTAPSRAQSEELRRLGVALEARAEGVLNRYRASTSEATLLDDVIGERVGDFVRAATVGFARWLAGESDERARQAGIETSLAFGQLGAQREVPLKELTKWCLRWRDATRSVLLEEARALRISTEAVDEALALLGHSADATLVRTGDAFDVERRRILDEVARWEEDLVFQATHDSLTGLPNRAQVLDRIRQAVARSRRSLNHVAVIFVDLDNFKGVNDSFGHGVGDDVLRAIAGRLERILREGDTLGRLGGDEFLIVVEGPPGTEGPEIVASRAIATLHEPFVVDGAPPIAVTASVGIAMGDSLTGEELLRAADLAMYQAKWTGKDRYVFFEPQMRRGA